MPQETTDTTANLRAWLLLHRVRDLAFSAQDRTHLRLRIALTPVLGSSADGQLR